MSTTTFTCGLDAALAILGGKWKPLVLFHLAHGVHRYGELRRAVGSVTDKVLIQQLKELQMDEVIERIDYKEIPPKVEYALTPLGRTLIEPLNAICHWAEKHLPQLEANRARAGSMATNGASSRS